MHGTLQSMPPISVFPTENLSSENMETQSPHSLLPSPLLCTARSSTMTKHSGLGLAPSIISSLPTISPFLTSSLHLSTTAGSPRLTTACPSHHVKLPHCKQKCATDLISAAVPIALAASTSTPAKNASYPDMALNLAPHRHNDLVVGRYPKYLQYNIWGFNDYSMSPAVLTSETAAPLSRIPSSVLTNASINQTLLHTLTSSQSSLQSKLTSLSHF